MKMKNLIYFFTALLFFSCRKDKPTIETVNISATSGEKVWISNEGNFQFGNSELSLYFPESNEVLNKIYESVNQKKLGDVFQSMTLFNNKRYLVLNNSNKIEIVNAQNLSSIGEISNLESPRYFLAINNSKAYVSDLYDDSISVINLNENKIQSKIACKGWTENMLMSFENVFVCNMKSEYIYIIDAKTDKLKDSILLSYASNSMVEDKFGKIWVLCSGDNLLGKKAGLHCIDPVSKTVLKSFLFLNTNDKPIRLKINAAKNELYFLNKHVFKFNINDNQLPSNPFISSNGKNFYALGIHPQNDEIYIGDAIDFIQKGKIYRYNKEGKEINTFLAGIIPGDFYFE